MKYISSNAGILRDSKGSPICAGRLIIFGRLKVEEKPLEYSINDSTNETLPSSQYID